VACTQIDEFPIALFPSALLSQEDVCLCDGGFELLPNIIICAARFGAGVPQAFACGTDVMARSSTQRCGHRLDFCKHFPKVADLSAALLELLLFSI
jgi:hypothetical protein